MFVWIVSFYVKLLFARQIERLSQLAHPTPENSGQLLTNLESRQSVSLLVLEPIMPIHKGNTNKFRQTRSFRRK